MEGVWGGGRYCKPFLPLRYVTRAELGRRQRCEGVVSNKGVQVCLCQDLIRALGGSEPCFCAAFSKPALGFFFAGKREGMFRVCPHLHVKWLTAGSCIRSIRSSFLFGFVWEGFQCIVSALLFLRQRAPSSLSLPFPCTSKPYLKKQVHAPLGCTTEVREGKRTKSSLVVEPSSPLPPFFFFLLFLVRGRVAQ